MDLFAKIFNGSPVAEYTFAVEAVQRLQQVNYIAYFAGGCVRDALMGNIPKDYDVATNATTEEVRALFGERHTLEIGAAFGVACVHGRHRGVRCQVEVATFRTDGSYSDGRHPDWIQYSTPEHDAQRRDFTINGMFYDPIANQLIDYVDGESDLKDQRIRAIGNAIDRFHEDKLRMLRAIRFAARFGFQIAPATGDALRSKASEIQVVSGERIAAELEKILTHPRRGWGMLQTHDFGLLEHVLPAIHHQWSTPEFHRLALQLLDHIDADDGSFATALACLYFPGLQAAASNIDFEIAQLQESLKLSNRVADAVAYALRHASALQNTDQRPWSEIQPILVHQDSKTAIALAKCVALAQEHSLDGVLRCEQALQWPADKLDPPPLISGGDLKRLRIPPGPYFSTILKRVRAMQLDGQIQSADQALEAATQIHRGLKAND